MSVMLAPHNRQWATSSLWAAPHEGQRYLAMEEN